MPITLPDGRVSFEWRDGPVLKAIREGAWLLLDEMNLASQAVLEALNSCFDFRGSLYVAELGRTFDVRASNDGGACCRFFAAQNPQRQGGSRKALPKSFLNRFTSIYVQPMSELDMRAVLVQRLTLDGGDGRNATERAESLLQLHARANEAIAKRADADARYAGAPWAFNLRDLLRLVECTACVSRLRRRERCCGTRILQLPLPLAFEMLYAARLQNANDRARLLHIALGESARELTPSLLRISADGALDFGGSLRLPRCGDYRDEALHERDRCAFATHARLLACQADALRRLAACVVCEQLALIVGPEHCGKRGLVETIARFANVPLRTMRLTAETDAQDLLGSYEQVGRGAGLPFTFNVIAL